MGISLRHTFGLPVALLSLLLLLSLTGCSPTKHVPQGEYLLDKVKIVTDSKEVKPETLKPYLRQEPNFRILGVARLQLAIYNLSGADTSKWINRWLRKIGTPPVIYDDNATQASCQQLSKALSNAGYMHAEVEADTTIKKRGIKVTYRITTNEPFYIDTIGYRIPHATIDSIVRSQPSLLKKGMLLDRSQLDKERERITTQLRQNGYYTFGKDLITFNADTSATTRAVSLTMQLRPMPSLEQNMPPSYDNYYTYMIRNVYVITDYTLSNIDLRRVDCSNAEEYNGIHIIYGADRYLTPSAITDNCRIRPGRLYSSRAVDRTYASFGRLTYLKNVNIRFLLLDESEAHHALDCYIFLTPRKTQNIGVELEGTNSEGDLGVAASLTYQHRNIFKGSETFTAEVRGAYESISGSLEGIINDHYTELGGRLGLKFPKFMFPFIPHKISRRLLATTDFDLSINFQQRPEYTRVIAGAAWRYNWTTRRERHQFDLLDINYVYLPQYMDGFLETIAPTNPLLRYSYEDHFIMRIGYTFYTSNIPETTFRKKNTLNRIYTLRTSVETSGNLLYAISNLARAPYDNGYKIFGIRYSQYVKGDMDYSYLYTIDERNTWAFHAGFGIGFPYGNSSVIPFEKRFYSGGANSVRGWSVRSLGPGSYNGQNNVSNFIYQCGDIRLDLSLEYRAKLFWKLEMATFIDAGNIWTIKEYETQPGGAFRFDSFYKQIALAWGLGLRLNFDYVIVRCDLGMKIYNPAEDALHWAITDPDLGRDLAFHITIGYPF